MLHPKKVLIIGSGGREHALAWKVAESGQLGELFVAPGNGGTAAIATNVALSASDVPGLVDFATHNAIDLTIVGPDDSLALGVVDAFRGAGLRIFGPTQDAAQIEASKAFSKQLMAEWGIATAQFEAFTNIAAAKQYLRGRRFPVVVKASGLALGKGVYICEDLAAAEAALADMMTGHIFGLSGSTVVIEDYLTGREVSIHAFCDGHTCVLFPTAQDHKAVSDGDTGPNTGGMGTYAPVPWAGPELVEQVKNTVVKPILAALAKAGMPFSGLLYPGLMLGSDGFNVLEFNARFGDPETQSYMRLLDCDLLEVIDACVVGRLSRMEIKWSDRTAVTIVLASGGYPGKYATGKTITGIDAAAALPDIVIFHAGTALKNGKIITNGGRVLGVSATGTDLRDAHAKAYAAVKLIHFEGMQYRTDIGAKGLIAA